MENDLNLYVDTSNKRDDGNEIESEIEIDKKDASDPKITENVSMKAKSYEQNFLPSGFSSVSPEEEKIDDDNNDERGILSDKEHSLQNVPQPIKDYTLYLKEKKTEKQKSLEKNLRIKQKREEYSARVKVRNTNAWNLMTIEEQNIQKLHRKNQILLSEKVFSSNLNHFSCTQIILFKSFLIIVIFIILKSIFFICFFLSLSLSLSQIGRAHV